MKMPIQEQSTVSVSEYIDILLRRKGFVVIPFVVITFIAVIIALSLPKKYKSSATLVMAAQIPKDIIDTLPGSYADSQITAITQRILTTTNSIAIIDKFGLYQDGMKDAKKTDLVEHFKADVQVQLAESLVGGLKVSEATSEIAFTISFTYIDPRVAKDVVAELTGLFIAQNDFVRSNKAEMAAGFLSEESRKLEDEIQDVEFKLSEFKKQHSESLPEQIQGTLALLDRKENDLRDTDQRISMIEERITFLSTELAKLEGGPGVTTVQSNLTPDDKNLIELEGKYKILLEKFHPTHPDVVLLKRQIRALKALDSGAASQTKPSEIASSEQEPTQLGRQGGVPEAETSKPRGKSEVVRSKSASPTLSSPITEEGGRSRSSPSLIALEIQLRTSEKELAGLHERKERLKVEINNINRRVSRAPETEKVYVELVRQRDQTLAKFNQLKEKLLDAKLVKTLEDEQHGKTMIVIDPPTVPEKAESGSRRKVAIGGAFGGLIAGLGLAFAIEFLSPGIRGYKALTAATGFVPLVVVPYIESPMEIEARLNAQRVRRQILMASALIGIMALLLSGITALIMFASSST